MFTIEKLQAIQKEILALGGNDLRLHNRKCSAILLGSEYWRSEEISTWIKSKKKGKQDEAGGIDNGDDDVCGICYTESVDPACLPDCKHCFCKSRIDYYVTKEISGNGATVSLTIPA